MHPATPAADQAIVRQVDELSRITTAFGVVRKDMLALRLLPRANDRLDHSDDLLAIVGRQLLDAYAAMEPDFTRILKADDARYSDDYASACEDLSLNDNEVEYVRRHGLTALAQRKAANDDAGPFVAAITALVTASPANDRFDPLDELVTKLAGGIL